MAARAKPSRRRRAAGVPPAGGTASKALRVARRRARRTAGTSGAALAGIVAGAIAARMRGIKGVRAAFVERSATAIARIATSADEHTLQDALAAATDVGTLATALSDAAVVGPSINQLDPMATLIARNIEHKAKLLGRAGGLLDVRQVADLLGVRRQAVDKRRRERKLLAVPRGADFRYPAAQFAEGEVVRGLPQILQTIGLEGPWGTLEFLLEPDAELEGESPLAWLKRHPDRLEPVLRLARAAGDHGA